MEKNFERFLGKEMDVVLYTGRKMLIVTTGTVCTMEGTNESLDVRYRDGRREKYKTNVREIGYFSNFVRITYNDGSQTFLDFF